MASEALSNHDIFKAVAGRGKPLNILWFEEVGRSLTNHSLDLAKPTFILVRGPQTNHWVMIRRDPKRPNDVQMFDSFGRPPPDIPLDNPADYNRKYGLSSRAVYEPLARMAAAGVSVRYNDQPLQSELRATCGHWCLAFNRFLDERSDNGPAEESFARWVRLAAKKAGATPDDFVKRFAAL